MRIEEFVARYRKANRSYREIHCFRCGEELDSDQHQKCKQGGWLICDDCAACGCEY